MSNDSTGSGPRSGSYDRARREARLKKADELFADNSAGARREAMLIYREHMDDLEPEEPDDAARVAKIAAVSGTVDPTFEPLFGRLASSSASAVHRDAALLASARIATARSDFHRAEALLRRTIRRRGENSERMSGLMALNVLWLTQGREHEATSATRISWDERTPGPVGDAYGHGHRIGAHAARQDWDATVREALAWDQTCRDLPQGVRPPSLDSVSLHASAALVELGDVAAAKKRLCAIRPEEAEPAHAEALRPVLALRAAQIAAREGDPLRAGELAAALARDHTQSPRDRADATVLAIELLALGGAQLRAAIVADSWTEFLHRHRQSLGSGIVLRLVARSLNAFGDSDRATDRPKLDPALSRELSLVAAAALADRVEELSRYSQDPDAPPAPQDEPCLRAFRRRFAVQSARILPPPEGHAATAQIAKAVGPSSRICPQCLVVEREALHPIPVGHLVAPLAAQLPGMTVGSGPCVACAPPH